MTDPEITAAWSGEVRATGGSLELVTSREITLDEIRSMIARAEALGVPADAVITRFSMDLFGAAQVRVSLYWQAPREAPPEPPTWGAGR